MSKRKLKVLVDEGIVRGWNDPRLYTLIAIRRRGVPPGALLSFVNELGVTTALTFIEVKRFEQSVRRYLETTVPRLMMVLDPLPVVVEDVPADSPLELDVPFSPKDEKFGTHKLAFTRTVYIDRSDFREEDSKGYFRLAPNKSVGLLQAPHPIFATSFEKDAEGRVSKVFARFDKEGKKPQTYIQWVPEGSRPAEVRVYNPLFKSDDPASVEGGFLSDVNEGSEVVYGDALVETGFEEVRESAPWPATVGEGKGKPEAVRFQAIRVGYFVSFSRSLLLSALYCAVRCEVYDGMLTRLQAMDEDSTADKVVLNRIVSLKEDSGKK
ncbi:hypothetical protein IMZ48_32165 [Candidatus Bathyarchaeota archaeon]|nr:hypothetical protein [Candidatus Bathyarchaeota archaeon]